MDLLFDLVARHQGHHDEEAEEETGSTEPPKHTHIHTHDPDRHWANRNHLLAHILMYSFLFVFATRLASSIFQSWQRRRKLNNINRSHDTERPRLLQRTGLLQKTRNRGRAVISGIKFVASTTIKVPDRIRQPLPFTNVPIGRILFVALYAVFVAGLLSYKVVKHDAAYAERIGFRGALIATPQVPIVCLLATRTQIPGLRYVLGGSYKDLIWFHRWIARVFIGAVSVHGIAFLVQWAPNNFLWEELEIVPYVKYGIYAWGVLLCTIITTILFVRKLSYEFFVVQHTICAFLALYLMRLHVPGHHRRSIDMAVGLIALDWTSRIITALYMNVSWKTTWGQCKGYHFGHKMTLEAVGSEMTVVTIHNANISFEAGQSIDIWVPKLWAETPHPFTILPPVKSLRGCECPRVQLALKTKTGFTAKLNRLAQESQTQGLDGFRCYILNKEGRAPPMDQHEVVVVVSSSTGASFSTAIAEKILSSPECKVRKIKVLLVGREKTILEYYRSRIKGAAEVAVNSMVSVSIHIATTGRGYDSVDAQADESENAPLAPPTIVEDTIEYDSDEEAEIEIQVQPKPGPSKKPPQSLQLKPLASPMTPMTPNTPFTSYTATSSVFSPGSVAFDRDDVEGKGSLDTDRSSLSIDNLDNPLSDLVEVTESFGRPDVASYMNNMIDGPFSTAVSVCGGSELAADVRTTVARIDMKRAANGVDSCYLYVEGFTEGS